MLVTRGFISQRLFFGFCLSISFRCQSRGLLDRDSQQSWENLGRGGVCEVDLYPLEWMLFSNQRFHFSIFIRVFHYLMKGGRDYRVAVNPWLSQQQTVGRISINDVTRHLRSQVSDLASELDLFHRACAISLEAINDSLSSTQRWVGIPKCKTLLGIMLNADPGSTWMRLTLDDLIYSV